MSYVAPLPADCNCQPDYGKALYERLAADECLCDLLRETNCEGAKLLRLHEEHVPAWGDDGEQFWDDYQEVLALAKSEDDVAQCRESIEIPAIRPWIWFEVSNVVPSPCMSGACLIASQVSFNVEVVAQTMAERHKIAAAFQRAVAVPFYLQSFGPLVVSNTIIEDAGQNYQTKSTRGADWGFHWVAFDLQIFPKAMKTEVTS